jgi:hypothetical protein
MKKIILALVAIFAGQVAMGQQHQGKSAEPFFDRYSFPNSLIKPDFSLDTTWKEPNSPWVHDSKRKSLHAARSSNRWRSLQNSGSNDFQCDSYTKHLRIFDSPWLHTYLPSDKMPCVMPEGSFHTRVYKPDPAWAYTMRIK